MAHRMRSGFTLIEALVVLFVVSVVITTFLSVFSQGGRLLIETEKKSVAVSIASEQMERIRNLAYADVGVVSGIPSGGIEPNEVRQIGTNQYRVVTDIRYYDNPHDGVFGGTPNDTVNVDQKIATVTVLWGEEEAAQRVSLSSLFVPPGIENISGSGTLSINIIDSSGSGVPGATVRIENSSEGVDLTTTTDSVGNILLPGAPESQQSYVITVSKSGYESVVTYPPHPTTIFFPVDEHASVLEGDLTNKVIHSSQLADMTVRLIDPAGSALSNILFSLSGGRVLGTTVDGDDVFSYVADISSDASGEMTVEDMSPGEYLFALRDPDLTQYKIISITPGSDAEKGRFSLEQGTDATYEVMLAQMGNPGLIVGVADDADGEVLVGAEVRIENATLGIDETVVTNSYGEVFFLDETKAIIGETYAITVTYPGYADETQNVTVSGLEEVVVAMISN